MKIAFLLITSVLFSLTISSCEEEDKNAQSSEILHPVANSEITITVKDYWEEAGSIKSEAEEIILRAEEINCDEAKKIAEKVILISKKAEANTNLLRVEHYIEEASQALTHAEDAITYCDEKDEISFASELKNDN